MRKICVVTGSRAEYGLLRGLMYKIKASDIAVLQIIATNMHLLPQYGETYKDIESDGFVVDEKVYMHRKGDTSDCIIESMSVELVNMNAAVKRLSPDLIVILGDRYEMFAVAIVALMNNIPMAHIHGGEITEGAFDDAIRHSLTKMSLYHFVSTEEYRYRVIQMGEDPERVFYVGSLGVENIHLEPRLSKREIEAFLGVNLDIPTVLVTYHPETRCCKDVAINNILDALSYFDKLQIIFTRPNSDPGSDKINKAIEYFSQKHMHRVTLFSSLGIIRYLLLIPYLKAVIGNSSSGIIEVPSFGIPTLNIGDRQKGRVASSSVLHCNTDIDSILTGIRTVLSSDFQNMAKNTKNPYDKEGTAEAIFDVISCCNLNSSKTFYDIKFDLL